MTQASVSIFDADGAICMEDVDSLGSWRIGLAARSDAMQGGVSPELLILRNMA